MMTSLDVCIVNHNTRAQVRRFLNYLLDTEDDYPISIYVADNGSEDVSVDYLKTIEQNYPDVHIVYNTNIGYARACNQLAAFGQGDIIALCNSDIWATRTQLMQIVDMFDYDPSLSIIGPKQRDESGFVTAGGIFGTLDAPKHRGWKVYDPEDRLYRDRQDAVTVSGSAYFIRRSVWNELTNCPTYKGLEVCQDSGTPLGAFLPTSHYY